MGLGAPGWVGWFFCVVGFFCLFVLFFCGYLNLER